MATAPVTQEVEDEVVARPTGTSAAFVSWMLALIALSGLDVFAFVYGTSTVAWLGRQPGASNTLFLGLAAVVALCSVILVCTWYRVACKVQQAFYEM